VGFDSKGITNPLFQTDILSFGLDALRLNLWLKKFYSQKKENCHFDTPCKLHTFVP
jgi:hypothetical protein